MLIDGIFFPCLSPDRGRADAACGLRVHAAEPMDAAPDDRAAVFAILES